MPLCPPRRAPAGLDPLLLRGRKHREHARDLRTSHAWRIIHPHLECAKKVLWGVYEPPRLVLHSGASGFRQQECVERAHIAMGARSFIIALECVLME
jgi:hypothetical protein